LCASFKLEKSRLLQEQTEIQANAKVRQATEMAKADAAEKIKVAIAIAEAQAKENITQAIAAAKVDAEADEAEKTKQAIMVLVFGQAGDFVYLSACLFFCLVVCFGWLVACF
jgi:mitochondrial fission protein ELM1